MADDIAQWLDDLGFVQYAEAFVENGVDFDLLPEITNDDLKDLGVARLADRKRLLKAMAGFADDDAAAAAGSTDAGVGASPSARTQAERRQLTVMFCDLVGSTELSTRLDPEDLREVIRAYQDTCAKVIARYDGFIAKYMGDGILVYFGYPRAHENDAERAARTGLGIVEAMAEIATPSVPGGDLELAVRVGIDTGLVVVGDLVGEGAAEEANVVGETPNIAARLQALARPGQVVIGPLTRELIGAAIACESLGEHDLKGIAEPVRAWRVVREGDIDGDQAAEPAGVRLPLVGRQEELGLLLRSWEASNEGHGQVVLVQGEAGIGKSRLVDALREHISGQDYIWVALRFSPYHANSTLYPIIEHLKRVMGWKSEDGAAEKLDKLEAALQGQRLPSEEAVPLIAELMSLPLPAGRYGPLELNAKQRREQTLDAISGWLLEIAERTPVLLVWEDLHWVDPTTLELLGLLIEQSPTVSMLNVLTYRPEFVPPWTMRSHMTPLTLNRLERAEVNALIGHQANGKAVPSEVIEHIVGKADGVPLYVEELTKTILESDYLCEEADRYTLSGSLSEVSIPATLQDSLMARLDRAPTLREVAQLGAVLGREFAYEMLRNLAPLEEPVLRNGLGQLVENDLLYQRGRPPRSRYIFKHALIQDAAYQSLLKRTRQQYHRQVAVLIEERFPETVEAHPELVAHHYTEAGEAERGVHHWRRAGERARAQSANVEAITYLTKGIALLHDLPDDEERARRELSLQVSLGGVNLVAKGHGAAGVEAAYTRALALCERLSDAPELVSTLLGLWRVYVAVRPLDETNDIALRISRVAEEKQDTGFQVVSSYALGYTALCMGNLMIARDYLEEGVARIFPARHRAEFHHMGQDPGVGCRASLGMTEWLLGYPERALGRMRDSVDLAEELDDPFSVAYAQCYTGAIISEVCGIDTNVIVGRGLDVATERGFSLWIAFGTMHRANEHHKDQRSESALDELRDSVAAISELGVYLHEPYFMTMLAGAYLRAGRIDHGLEVLDRAQQSTDARGERWWEAEIRRLRGELLLSRSETSADQARACFEQALDIARDQNAKSLELRAAMSLARLWRDRREVAEAKALLTPIHDWFTEGFDTADLKQAKALLDELG